MNNKSSHKENLEAIESSLYEIGMLLDNKYTTTEISELIPGTIHINSLEDFTLQYFDSSGEDVYKCSFEEVRSTRFKMLKDVIHPEDYINIPPQLFKFASEKDNNSIYSFFQRLKGVSEKHYEWYFTSSKISDKGLISVSHSIRNLRNHKSQIERILDENIFFKKNFKKFLSLTKREKQILKELAIGKTAPKISEEFFISVNTVKTHRQRIFEKLEVKTFTELYRYAFHFDLL